MTEAISFGQVLEAADHLSPDEQEQLIAILRRRLSEAARQQLVTDVKQARQQFLEGQSLRATPDELMREIMK